LNKKCSKLSGGNLRKLSLACAFIGNPKIIIIDEPTIGLDPISKQNIWKLIL
jgi:ABC-type multidrug transport system ATPase subunit